MSVDPSSSVGAPPEFDPDGSDPLRWLHFFGFTEDDRFRLLSLHPSFSSVQPDLVDSFIRHLSSFGPTHARLPSESARLDHFKTVLTEYFNHLTSGRYDDDYIRSRQRVGCLHVEMRTPPVWYLGAWTRYLSSLLERGIPFLPGHDLRESSEAFGSFLKIVFFDIALTLEAYFGETLHKARLLGEYDDKLLKHLPDGLLLLGADHTILSANPAFFRQFDLTSNTVLGRPLLSILPSEELDAALKDVQKTGTLRRTLEISPRGRGHSQVPHPVRLTLTQIRPTEEVQTLALFEDLSLEQALRIQAEGVERRFVTVAETALSGIILVDSSGMVLYFNAAAERIFGIRRSRIQGQALARLLPHLSFASLSSGADSQGVVLETQGCREDGITFPVEVSASRFQDGAASFVTLVLRDLTEQKEFESRLLQVAHTDPLTGLPNRTALVDRLSRLLGSSESLPAKGGALLYLDLDRFKGINDSLGHDRGDDLIREVGKRLSSCVRRSDFVARTGGDEFMVILEGLSNREDVRKVAETILDEVARPFDFDPAPVFVNASIGMVVWPEDGKSVDFLLRRADIAMYRAKEIGQAAVAYSEEDGQKGRRRYETERELRRALENNEFVLYFQPQVDLSARRLVGAEALIRWNHPERGLVSPDQFIPVAESSGLIVAIGTWVIEEACRQLMHWKNSGTPPFRLTVNVSGRQFERGSLADIIKAALERSGAEGRLLEVEITESILMTRSQTTAVLQELSALGVRTSIDDFGTGYSSLSYLTRLPVYKLKIDRSFVTTLSSDPNVRAITTAIITMSSALGLRTIAEGVETREQLDILKKLGCHEIQGYYFSPPLPVEDFSRWMASPFPAKI
ncbi:MAG: EAL domain-containing protein [Nitrospiraceae bacterium]|nr:EAL domain-containing protein [Nitrospiraceae bacterium]